MILLVSEYILNAGRFAQLIGGKCKELSDFLSERTIMYVIEKISEDDEAIGVNRQAKGQATKGAW